MVFADQYSVDNSPAFESWEQHHKASAETIQTVGKSLTDAVVIAVQNHMHAELVVVFAAQGDNILCEEPLATRRLECRTKDATGTS